MKISDPCIYSICTVGIKTMALVRGKKEEKKIFCRNKIEPAASMYLGFTLNYLVD